MEMTDRERHINNLTTLKHFYIISGFKTSNEIVASLDYAISSIKGDEASIKDEALLMVTELLSEIEKLPMYYDPNDISYLIQQKIDTWKGTKDGNAD